MKLGSTRISNRTGTGRPFATSTEGRRTISVSVAAPAAVSAVAQQPQLDCDFPELSRRHLIVQLSPIFGPPVPSRIGLLHRAWKLSFPGAGRKNMLPPLPAAAGSQTAFPDSSLTRKTPPSSTSPGNGDRISTLEEVQFRTPNAERTRTSLPPPARRKISQTNFIEPPSMLSTAYEQRADASRGTGVDHLDPASLAGLNCKALKLCCRS